MLKNKTARTISSILIFALTAGVIIVLINANSSGTTIENRDYLINSILPFIVLPLLVIVLSLSLYFSDSITSKFEKEIISIRTQREEITQKIEKEKEKELDIFHTIQLSLNQLNEYYTINKNQARSSFRFSIFSIIIGLITILTGIWLYYLDISNIEVSYIAGISGVILEFIGGAYFFMYKKSLEQVNFFFGQLIKIQDTMLSINLADNIGDEARKTEIHEKIIISLLERSLK